jgi:serine phosphatase RsbU (regulator of sigma subunit)
MTAINRFWKTIPPRATALFLLGVFVIFSIIAFTQDTIEMGREPTTRLVLGTLLSGLSAVGYALCGFFLRKHFWKGMLPLGVVHGIAINWLVRAYPTLPEPAFMDASGIARTQSRLSFDGSAIIVAVAVGYTCFLVVSITEGRRYARLHAEIELATEIHHVLVPPIEITIANFEFYGRSVPSGEVGGDLIDVAASPAQPDDWVAYVADVSGHGVAPGVVMGMVKSSARMLLSSGSNSGGDSSHLMARLNEVLYPLKKPDMFITFCFLAHEAGVTRIGLAGHPPILHFSAPSGTVSACESPNMPLGILPEGDFASSVMAAQRGDVFLLYTDGFVEAANAAGEEFGQARLQAEFQKHAREPLEAITVALQAAVNGFGPQFDDQSLLLIRHL